MVEPAVEPSRIEDELAGKSILLTGFTGFVGKCLVWKLLHSIPQIGNIYVLVRGNAKTKKSANDRLQQMLTDIPFSHFDSNLRSKIVLVEGDLGVDWASLSELKDVVIDVVIHAAATVNFEESLSTAIEVNALSTGRLLDFCQSYLKPRIFLYVSTGYSHCDVFDHVTEEIPDMNCTPEQVLSELKCVEVGDENSKQCKLIGSKPNSYVFAKGLSENMLKQRAASGSCFPIVIARPTIIGAAYQEPAPGFIDNYNALTGAWLAYGHGIWRVTANDPTLHFDCIPVDLCVNGILATVAYHLHLNNSDDSPPSITWSEPWVVNLCTSSLNPCKWTIAEKTQWSSRDAVPFDNAVRYPLCFAVKTKIQEKIIRLFYQDLFAKLYDVLLIISGNKFRLSRITNKMYKLFETTSYFIEQEWTWQDTNLKKLHKQFSSQQQIDTFPILATELDWHSYYATYYMGIKKYVLRENTQDMRVAKRRQKFLKFMHYIGEPFILVLLLVLFIFFIHASFTLLNWGLSRI